MSAAALSSPTPPYSSGASTPSRPEFAGAAKQLPRERPVLLLEAIDAGHHFLFGEFLRGSGDQPMLVRHALGREDRRRIRRFQQPWRRPCGGCLRHSKPLKNARGAHAAADAHRHESVSRVPAAHFVEQSWW